MPYFDESKKSFSERISNGIDGVIGFFSPAAAARRMAARYVARTMFGSEYRGASRDRTTYDWNPRGYSADESLLYELPTLRSRSRDLVRNNPYAAGAIDTVTVNVVGSGLRPQSRIPHELIGIPKGSADEFQRQAEYIWHQWTPFADAANKIDFYDMEALIIRQILENGEVLILPMMVDDPIDRPLSTAFDIIEADRLATPPGRSGDKKIRSGVEIGDRGQPLAYWVKKTHPGDITVGISRQDDYIRYPAYRKDGRRNIIHIFPISRPGQTRGAPFFAPAMQYFKDMAAYMEAEIVAARIAACFAIFVESPDPSLMPSMKDTRTDTASGRKKSWIEPGMMQHLAPGEKISSFAPDRPNSSADAFINHILRAIGSSLGLPYELLVKDFSKTNYSSARAALLEARRFFQNRRVFLTKYFCQPVWSMVLEEAYLRDKIKAPRFYQNYYGYTRTRWIAGPWGWVDPTKEIDASLKAVDGNISTMSDEIAAQGQDYEEVIEQRAREKAFTKKMEEKYGIKLSPEDKPATPQDPGNSGAEDPDSEPADPDKEPKTEPAPAGQED